MNKLLSFILLFAFLTLFSCGDENNTPEPEIPEIPEEPEIPTETSKYLPLVKISIENGAEVVDKDKYLNAVVTISTRDDKGNAKEVLLPSVKTEIKGRGNSTWRADKKPYRLKLNEKAEVMGMPSNKHWVLLANALDKTLLRNELVFEISRRMQFGYTPRSKSVELVMNDTYRGAYTLVEHIRIDKNRLNIKELKASDADYTGGYFLEIDNRDGKNEPQWFRTTRSNIGTPADDPLTFVIKDPEDAPQHQLDYIQNYIQNIEDIIYGDKGANIISQLSGVLDMKSFIDYYILNELSKNVDGNFRLSTFLYKDAGDPKVYFGPVWDYDIAFGNGRGDNRQPGYGSFNQFISPTGWYVKKAQWYEKLFALPEFDNMVKNRWKELSSDFKTLPSYIDEYVKQINEAQKSNFQKWDINKVYEGLNNPIIHGSYTAEVTYLKKWLSERITWLDSQWK